MMALVDSGARGADLEKLRSTIGLRGSQPLSLWNDAPDRTQAEVVAAFRRAAAPGTGAGEGGSE